jgi:hypothetical protein
MPAPVVRGSGERSSTRTSHPQRSNAFAAVSPAIPAPTTTALLVMGIIMLYGALLDVDPYTSARRERRTGVVPPV